MQRIKMILAILLYAFIGPSALGVQRAIPADTSITLIRTNCFYTCPDYAVTISADGNVLFEGKANVKVKGRAQIRISLEKVQALIAAFEKAKFFSLKNRYVLPEDGCRVYSGDSPSATLSIVIGGKTKSIDHNLGCRQKKGNSVRALIELENQIDDLTNTAQWID
jgi:hypothetical protein